MLLREDCNSLVRNNQTFAMAADHWRKAKELTAAPSSLLRYDMALSRRLLLRFGRGSARRAPYTPMLDDSYAELRERGMAPNSIAVRAARPRARIPSPAGTPTLGACQQ